SSAWRIRKRASPSRRPLPSRDLPPYTIRLVLLDAHAARVKHHPHDLRSNTQLDAVAALGLLKHSLAARRRQRKRQLTLLVVSPTGATSAEEWVLLVRHSRRQIDDLDAAHAGV